MISLLSTCAALAFALQGTWAAPATTTTTAPTTTAAPNVVGNIFSGKKIYANSYYASEIKASAIPSLPASLVPKASAVANVGTFYWL